MTIVKIFDVHRTYTVSNGFEDIRLEQIARTEIKDKDKLDSLTDYLSEITPVANYIETVTSATFFIENTNEQMEGMPLGDGVVIHANGFDKGEYAVVIQKPNAREIMGVIFNA